MEKERPVEKPQPRVQAQSAQPRVLAGRVQQAQLRVTRQARQVVLVRVQPAVQARLERPERPANPGPQELRWTQETNLSRRGPAPERDLAEAERDPKRAAERRPPRQGSRRQLVRAVEEAAWTGAILRRPPPRRSPTPLRRRQRRR